MCVWAGSDDLPPLFEPPRGADEVETIGVTDPDPGSRREEKLKPELWQVHLYRLSPESFVLVPQHQSAVDKETGAAATVTKTGSCCKLASRLLLWF